MKHSCRRWLFSITFLGVFFITSCEEQAEFFDDRLSDLESRVAKLEQLCSEMNTNISSLQALIARIQQNDQITTVNPIEQNGKVIGYTISFVNNSPITIYHGSDGKDGIDGVDGHNGQDGKDGAAGRDGKDGHTPVIAVQQDADGVWYWTLDGSWL